MLFFRYILLEINKIKLYKVCVWLPVPKFACIKHCLNVLGSKSQFISSELLYKFDVSLAMQSFGSAMTLF